MWERFTYYGMRAILILFLVTAVGEGGLGIDDRTASSIYGLYIAATYVFSLLGGWIGDRLTGAQRVVIGGGVLIVIGNALLVSAIAPTFLLGLMIIVLGVGLLKPNISVMVAHPLPTIKFAVGLALLSVAFLVMYAASQRVLGGVKVLPTLLIVTYLLMEWGDLCISPVGLSSMTQLALRRFGGQVMGLFYSSLGLGNNLAGQLSLEYDASDLHTLPRLFLKICGWGLAGAAGMLLLTPALRRLISRAPDPDGGTAEKCWNS